jgi:hypothetical protein
LGKGSEKGVLDALFAEHKETAGAGPVDTRAGGRKEAEAMPRESTMLEVRRRADR